MVNALCLISEVTLCWAQIVLGRPSADQPPRLTQPSHPFAGKHSEYQQKPGHKQAQCMMHYLAVYAGVWLRAKETEIRASL